MARYQVVMHIAQGVGRVHLRMNTFARADVPHVLYLRNGCTDCTGIWCAARNQLDRRFTQVNARVHPQVRTCASPFRISGTAGRIALKFWCSWRSISSAFYTNQGWGTPARAHVPLRTPFPYLWINWTHNAEIWCIAGP